jgi:alkylation response protein AidB-like acyl-CoA dehydrogenase
MTGPAGSPGDSEPAGSFASPLRGDVDDRSSAFRLTEDQAAIRDLARSVAQKEFAPRVREWDRDNSPLPAEVRLALGELDLIGISLPEDVGGSGRPLLDALIVLEEIAKVCQLAAWPVFEASSGAARVVDLCGTPEQRRRLLPSVVSGKNVIAVAISEADAGSAATDLTTRARVEDGSLIMNGVKRWCSGAGRADKYLVYCRMSEARGSKGIGAAIVDADTPGLTVGPQERMMGFHGIGSADISLDNVQVPLENVVMPAGGFSRLFEVFSIERLGNATMSLAIAQTALDRCATYVTERRQFGREIVEFQLVQASIADMVMQTDAARLLVYRAAEGAGRGTPSALETSIAKCFANETAKRVSDMAMQLHGGYGYTEEYELERLQRDAHGWALAGGTANMQRIRIASEYLGRRFDQRGA